MTEEQDFVEHGRRQIAALGSNDQLGSLTLNWLALAQQHKYSYHFRWLGRPIIQYPQDIVAMQELIWAVQPDLIIETGVARGGSLIFSASMLALLDICSPQARNEVIPVATPKRRVVGIDVDIRPDNRSAIEAHPLSPYITLIQGSSIDDAIVRQVAAMAQTAKSVLVCLDSNHTHAHVLAELEAYAPLTTVGSYCVVFDTVIENLPPEAIGDRPWSKGNNPHTAVHEFLRIHPEFQIEKEIDHKLLISVATDGYLRRTR